MADDIEWYRGQVVFLTGGTGYLGACLLYKLAVQLPTRRVFVLCSNSVQRALAKLEASIPEQIDEILDTRKIHFVVGNISQPDWGLKQSDLQRLADEVTVVLHAAAATSIQAELSDVVKANCLSSFFLLSLLKGFRRLNVLLYISSAFVNMFVQDAVIKEELYSISSETEEHTPRDQITSIMESGTSPLTDTFPNPYILSKYLAEKAILSEGDNLPFSLLIVRPSLISPAISDPYPSYGVDSVTPVYAALQMLVSSREYGFERLNQELSPQAVVDEIPVDLVATTCLAHLAKGTTGIIHAASDLYIRFTIHDIILHIREYTPREYMDQILHRREEGKAIASYFYENAKQYSMKSTFDSQRSMELKGINGPLGLSLEGHDPLLSAKRRIERMSRIMAEQLRTKNKY